MTDEEAEIEQEDKEEEKDEEEATESENTTEDQEESTVENTSFEGVSVDKEVVAVRQQDYTVPEVPEPI